MSERDYLARYETQADRDIAMTRFHNEHKKSLTNRYWALGVSAYEINDVRTALKKDREKDILITLVGAASDFEFSLEKIKSSLRTQLWTHA